MNKNASEVLSEIKAASEALAKRRAELESKSQLRKAIGDELWQNLRTIPRPDDFEIRRVHMGYCLCGAPVEYPAETVPLPTFFICNRCRNRVTVQQNSKG